MILARARNLLGPPPRSAYAVGGRRDAVVLSLLCLAVVGLPFLLAAISGNLDVSHNDDFSYRLGALGFFRTGQFELDGWPTMTLVGQLMLAQPFLWLSGGREWALVASTCALGVVALVASYSLLRHILPLRLAAAGTLCLLVFPGIVVYVVSFMTDVPSMSGELLCLALAAGATRRVGKRRAAWMAASLLAGCMAFSIREFGVAAPVAALIFFAVCRATSFRRYIVACVVTGVALLAIYAFATSLPGQQPRTFVPKLDGIGNFRFVAATLGLGLSPWILRAATVRGREWRIRDFAAGALGGIILYRTELASLVTTWSVPRILAGNLLEPLGPPGGMSIGAREILLGSPIWDVLELVGVAAVIAGFGIISAAASRMLRRPRNVYHRGWVAALASTEGLLAIFCMLYGGGLVVYGTGAPLYDRYAWPLAVPLAGLLLSQPRRWSVDSITPAPRVALWASKAGIAVLAALITCVSAALLLNGLAFDGAGWRMGQVAVQRGFTPGTVDAGMAWVGYYATGRVQPGRQPLHGESWYIGVWPSAKACAVVSGSPLEGPGITPVAIDVEAYSLLLFVGPQEPMYVYGTHLPGCS